ncbi:replication protein RepA [Methylobacterium sp.]|uniref:replication protein RepA n=1 Tax=Methylobacterium sp. TaxID=409 RepID=UPI00257CE1FC|nr:replication protein RepA [Methylobacterium sp.]
MTDHEERKIERWERTLTQSPPQGGDPGERLQVSFLHKGFCIAGLPLRRPRDANQPWSRQDGRFALTVGPSRFTLPDGRTIDVGIPFGPKARLLTMWLTTEARDPGRGVGDRWIELGRITDWLQAVGLPVTGGERGSIGATKDQLLRLAFSNFTMILRGEDATTLFKREVLIEAGAFGTEDLEMWSSGSLGSMNWPHGLKLSANAFERFRRHSVAIPTARLRQVAHNALSIDLLVYLCFRLPLIDKGESDLIRWQDLNAQFGTSEFTSKFRQSSSESLKHALEAYPEARVEVTAEGLILRPSDPLELRRAFYAPATPRKPAPRLRPVQRTSAGMRAAAEGAQKLAVRR